MQGGHMTSASTDLAILFKVLPEHEDIVVVHPDQNVYLLEDVLACALSVSIDLHPNIWQVHDLDCKIDAGRLLCGHFDNGKA